MNRKLRHNITAPGFGSGCVRVGTGQTRPRELLRAPQLCGAEGPAQETFLYKNKQTKKSEEASLKVGFFLKDIYGSALKQSC